MSKILLFLSFCLFSVSVLASKHFVKNVKKETKISLKKDCNKKVVNKQKAELKRLKQAKPDLKFKPVISKPNIQGLKIPGNITKYGADNTDAKIILTLCFKNLAEAAEHKYHLPSDLLSAMIFEESTGVPYLANAKNDGGFGLIHMQPRTAQDFSLKVYADCNRLVCKKHAKELKALVEKNKNNPAKLCSLDDRLHHLLNIDAAARMIAYFMKMKPIKGLSRYQSAIKRYAGKHNYESYLADIEKNRAMFKNKKQLKAAADVFNKLNPNLRINNKPADIVDYLRISQRANLNFDLDKYRALK